MIKLQELVDRIEEEFGLEFKGEENYYYIEKGSLIFIDSFNIDRYRGKVDVTVRLTDDILEVEIQCALFHDRQIDEFIYRLKNIFSAAMF